MDVDNYQISNFGSQHDGCSELPIDCGAVEGELYTTNSPPTACGPLKRSSSAVYTSIQIGLEKYFVGAA